MTEEVRAIPLGTLTAIVAEFPRSGSGRGRSKPSEALNRIPVQPRFGQSVHRHGYVGMDYVEQCGSRSGRRYALTGTYTELYNVWGGRVRRGSG